MTHDTPVLVPAVDQAEAAALAFMVMKILTVLPASFHDFG